MPNAVRPIPQHPDTSIPRQGLAELAGVFLRLGLTAFGGPAAHIAMMRREFVERRQWLSDEEYADMIGAANLVPGPSSTEVAIHVGYRRAGGLGLIIAGLCFILPAALIVGVIAALYKAYGSLPEARHAMYGIKPVVIAIIAQALWGLGKTVLKKPLPIVLALGCAAAGYLAVMPLILLLGSGALTGGLAARSEKSLAGVKPLLVLLGSVALVAALPWLLSLMPQANGPPGAGPVFLSFLKIGSVLYGTGYVLLAFLKSDLVLRHTWLTQGQLLDAVAVGQFTPGPVFTTATFIGYVLGGPVGAVAATVGIFLPAFVFVGISGRYLRQLRDSPTSAGFLDGVNAAAIGLIAAVTVQLGREALIDAVSVGIAAVSLGVLLRFKVNSAWMILAGGVIGMCAALR
ncbi:MAG: chromate efflux transporter [Fimbriimonadales bacterium]